MCVVIITFQGETEPGLKCEVARVTVNLALNEEFIKGRCLTSQDRGEAQSWDKESNNSKVLPHGD